MAAFECKKHPHEWGDHMCSDCAWNAGFMAGLILAGIAIGFGLLIWRIAT